MTLLFYIIQFVVYIIQDRRKYMNTNNTFYKYKTNLPYLPIVDTD